MAERRLAAIMFTDIVGYTTLMARDEEAGRRARTRHEEVVRPLVERYHGQWIERTGDETLSAFPSALDAVNCALAVQTELDGDADLQLRIGIHHGDVTFDADGVSGDGVNVAARVRPMAKPGGICVSGDVRHSVRGRSGLELNALGEQEFKNVDHSVAVYSVTGTAAAPRPVARPSAVSRSRSLQRAVWAAVALVVIAVGAGWWLYRPATELAPIRSIAVLPLENLSGDPAQEYFADGMTEAVISEFAQIASLNVISRTSVMQYRKARKPLPEIARELNVHGVIEGSVVRAGDHVRITLQLIDARNDHHLWAQSYERDLRDVLATQGEIARAVATAVQAELSPEEQAALDPIRPVDVRAYDEYLRGLQQARGSPDGAARLWAPVAIAHFERAVELDPGFAEAWTQLAASRSALAVGGFNRNFRGEFEKARVAAKRALELDDRQASAHATLGEVRYWHDWDLQEAAKALDRAQELAPDTPYVLLARANYLIDVGRRNEAELLLERALRVAPLDGYLRARTVSHFLNLREYERGLQEAERARELDESALNLLEEANCYRMLGRHEDAHRLMRVALEMCGELCQRQLAAWERGWAEAGWEGALRRAHEVFVAEDGLSSVIIAWNAAGFGDADEAFKWLERGYNDRDPLMLAVGAHLLSDPLRSDPRFEDLLRRIGFPES